MFAWFEDAYEKRCALRHDEEALLYAPPLSTCLPSPTVVLTAPAEDVAVESGKRVMSANPVRVARVTAATAATRISDAFAFK